MKLCFILLTLLLTTEQIHSSRYRRADNPLAYKNYLTRANAILDRVPLIDGHNDLPWTLRNYSKNQVAILNITDLTQMQPWASSPDSHTDILRLRQGKVGAQFWAAYVGCATQYKDAVTRTWEQIDVVHRLVKANPNTFEFVTSAQGIEEAFARGKIGSLIGVEGGHSIDSSLSVLRMMYDMGVRYMTLTHSCPTPWADNSQLDNAGGVPVSDGLSAFGKMVVKEMNRLGMLLDLSHISRKTMKDALETSTAPVIFSHSSAYAVCNNTRNVPDDILRLVAQNKGVVMVNFYSDFVTCGISKATIEDVANHMDHILNIAGADSIGIGADYNGVTRVPEGLEDVSKYPDLFAVLLSRGWTETDLEKVAGLNLLRVFRGAEAVRDQMAANSMKPFDDWIPQTDMPAQSLPCNTGDYGNRTNANGGNTAGSIQLSPFCFLSLVLYHVIPWFSVSLN